MYIIIIGCGRVGSELARILAGQGHNVVMIDRNANSFDRLGPSFNGMTINGNGFDFDILKQAGIEKADAVAVVTNGDNTNLMAAQVAKNIFKVPKVVARLYDPKRAFLYRQWGLDVISGTSLVAAMIRDRIVESRFTGYLIETADLGTIELEVSDKLVDKKVDKINIPGEFMVVTVVRKEGVILPQSDTVLHKGDRLIGIVKTESLNKVRKAFGLK
jgi:trk system potassium uptake protein TrkA